MRLETRNFFRYYGPALLWTVVIFAFSTHSFSAEQTGNFLLWLIVAVYPHVSWPEFHFLHLLIRKVAHLVVYAVLSLLWFRAHRGPGKGWRREWALAAVLVSMLIAGSDEVHQSFVRSRTATPWDVLLDTFGALLAQAVIALRARRKPHAAA